MQTEALSFVMQYAGYRFQQASLRSALRYDANIFLDPWRGWVVGPRYKVRVQLRELGFSPTFRGVDSSAETCSEVIHDALAEYRRRTAKS